MNRDPSTAPVNAPQPVRVSTNAAGQPVMVQIKSRPYRVQAVTHHWVQPPSPPEESRSYFLLTLEQETLCCVFLALERGQWYRQRISQKGWHARVGAAPPERERRSGWREPRPPAARLWTPYDVRPSGAEPR